MPISESKAQQDSKVINSGAAVANRQSTAIYRDYRETDPIEFVFEAYNGTGGFSGRTNTRSKHKPYSYIIANASENFYITRCQMSIYLNYFKKYINAKYKPIFKGNAKTYVETPNGAAFDEHLYLDFVKNITGTGVSLTEFMKVSLRNALISDVSFLIMDKYDDEVLPFVYLRNSNDIVDYTLDDKGRLVSVVFNLNPINGVYRQRYIGVDKWEDYQSKDGKKWTVVSSRDNSLGFLPVYAIFTERGEDLNNYRPHPSNYDIAGFCAWSYDKGSKVDYVIDKQAHSILALQGNIDQVPNGVDNALVIGESSNSIFPPQYLSPDAAMPTVHRERIDQVTASMFDLMADAGVSVQEVTAPESGVAKSYKFSAANDTLKSNVAILKQVDTWLADAFKRFTLDTGDWVAYTEYPTDFTPTSALSVEQATALIEFYGIENLPENQIDVHMRLRQIIDPMSTKEDEAALIEEIRNRYKRLD